MVIFNTDDTVTLPMDEYLALSGRGVINTELEYAAVHAHLALFGPEDGREAARQDFMHAVRRWRAEIGEYQRAIA